MHLKLGILFHSWNLKFGLIHKLWKHFIFPISLQNSILMFLWRVPLSPPALSIRICKRLPNRKWHNLSTLTWNKDRRILKYFLQSSFCKIRNVQIFHQRKMLICQHQPQQSGSQAEVQLWRCEVCFAANGRQSVLKCWELPSKSGLIDEINTKLTRKSKRLGSVRNYLVGSSLYFRKDMSLMIFSHI